MDNQFQINLYSYSAFFEGDHLILQDVNQYGILFEVRSQGHKKGTPYQSKRVLTYDFLNNWHSYFPDNESQPNAFINGFDEEKRRKLLVLKLFNPQTDCNNVIFKYEIDQSQNNLDIDEEIQLWDGKGRLENLSVMIDGFYDTIISCVSENPTILYRIASTALNLFSFDAYRIIGGLRNDLLPCDQRTGEWPNKPEELSDLILLADMERSTYYRDQLSDSKGWDLIFDNEYIRFFQKDDVIIVAIRGTQFTDFKDLIADVRIIGNGVRKSSRFEKDLEILCQFQTTFPPRIKPKFECPNCPNLSVENLQRYRYYGVAHSLGGAILDKFLEDGLIEAGVSFNPAVERIDLEKDNGNHRIYLSCDPLYNVMGRYITNGNLDIIPLPNSSQIPDSDSGVIEFAKGALRCHGIENFL